ncbi:MAG: hypothetical protein HKN30_15300, partial [Sulfitobacter sp.]|nr:hypothetical protein [Sulfitobacter sp.]
NLAVLMIALFALKEKIRLWPQARTAQLLTAGLILCAIPTTLTNTDALVFEVMPNTDPIKFITNVIPGQSWHDLGSVLAIQLLALVPFLLGRHFLASEDGLREILLALTVGGLVYSIPALFEIRFSPQINIQIYGFFQHDFAQMIRQGGYRPIVFLTHGLWVAILMATSLLACAALARHAPPDDRFKMFLLVAYLFVLLVLCKSLASLLYGIAFLPAVLFLPRRWQVWLACFIGLLAVAYPMLRNGHFIPLDWILDRAGEISVDRQQSLGYRFNNEEQLLARASEKPLFGWGAWGRNLFRDPETGMILTVPDGRWIIIFGAFGWLGYICEFGLLSLPLWLTLWSLRRKETLSPWVAPLCLILGMTMLDMLLNDTLTPVTWLIAGAILGHAERRMPRTVEIPDRETNRTVLSGGRTGGGRRTVL